MKNSLSGCALALVLAGGLVSPPVSATVQVGGQQFPTWGDYFASAYFHAHVGPCLTDEAYGRTPEKAVPSDCGAGGTVLSPEYAPTRGVIRIPVVFHVITTTDGEGMVGAEAIAAQVAILNEDFRALAGTPGAGGIDTGIEFYLADVDPDGQPTAGVTVTANNSWYVDAGVYWEVLAWDTRRYVNVYTNTASGALGYVPALPAANNGEILGSREDRIVVNWTTVGRDAVAGPPYDQGRTLVHEMGHYLGLFHPFAQGCTPATAPACFVSGDLICDTAPQGASILGCPEGTATCGLPDPIDNYMGYANDVCMTRFTAQQAQRMRCTLLTWRTMLGERDLSEGSAEGEGDGEGGGEGGGEGEGEGAAETCPENLLGDGGLELGTINPFWSGGSSNFSTPICRVSSCGFSAGIGAAEGTYWAWFGGVSGAVEEAWLEQTLVVPRAPLAQLRFALAMPQSSTAGYLRVLVDGVTLREIDASEAPGFAQYAEVVLDLSARADGGEHVLRLEARTEAGSGPTNFFVDSICVQASGGPPQSADSNGDFRIDLSELLRVIQFFNTGAYSCLAGTEDGFAPGTGAQDCSPHATDYAVQDWAIDLSELLRCIQVFNVAGYYACAEGEDGYCLVLAGT